MIKKVLLFAVFAGFLLFAVFTVQEAMPEKKEARIYKLIHEYSPYQLEKRFGGLSIVDKNTHTKEKPPTSLVLHRLDDLEKQWGRKHVQVKGEDVIIIDNNGTQVGKIALESQREKDFVVNFFNSKGK